MRAVSTAVVRLGARASAESSETDMHAERALWMEAAARRPMFRFRATLGSKRRSFDPNERRRAYGNGGSAGRRRCGVQDVMPRTFMVDSGINDASSDWEGASAFDPDERTAPVMSSHDAAAAEFAFNTAETLGRYVVLGTLGEGGMGVVLRAYDPKLRREVALKCLKPNTKGGEGRVQLVREARAMAKLSDANVVAVYDVEQHGETVILVMEYVQGLTLDVWQTASQADLKGVVEMYRQAGRGLAAAHRRSLLHRDFKPRNVVVSRDGVAKVTDFGIARISTEYSQSSSSSGMSSREMSADDEGREDPWTDGGVVVGTPRYMPPEQFNPGPIDASADQYAFCTSLWHALTGSHPFGSASRMSTRLRERKLEGPPRWPTNIKVPARWSRALSRGLAAAPSERWPSMDALLEELEPPRTGGRMRWVPRMMAGFAVAGAAAGAYIYAEDRRQRCSGAEEEFAAVWNADRSAGVVAAFETIASRFAADAGARVQGRLDAYAEAWATSHREACAATAIRAEQSPATMDLRMYCLARAKATFDATVEILETADVDVVRRADTVVAGLAPLARCDDVAALASAIAPPAAKDAESVAGVRDLLAKAKASLSAGRFERAGAATLAARSAAESVDYGPVQTELAYVSGLVDSRLANYDNAERSLSQALELAQRHGQRELSAKSAGMLMFVVGNQQQRPAEGLRYLPVAVGAAASDETLLRAVEGYHVTVLLAADAFEDALQRAKDVVSDLRAEGPGPDRSLSVWLGRVGEALQGAGRHREAEAVFREILSLEVDRLGTDHPYVATMRTNLASEVSAQGRYSEAEALYDESLAALDAVFEPSHPEIVGTMTGLGGLLYQQGRFSQAEAKFRDALARVEASLGTSHPHSAGLRNNVALTLAAQERFADAEREYRVVLAAWIERFGHEHLNVALARYNLALTLGDQGKFDAAEAMQREALGILEALLPKGHPSRTESVVALAGVLFAVERFDEAREFAEQAWVARQADQGAPEDRAESAFLLAQILWASDETPSTRTRAVELAQKALETFEAGEAEEGTSAAEARAWLAERDVAPTQQRLEAGR